MCTSACACTWCSSPSTTTRSSRTSRSTPTTETTQQGPNMTTVPPSDWLVSVDDHVIEPPNVWLDRLPSKYHDRAPRMAKGERGAVWQYEDKLVPTVGLSVAAGKEKEEFSPN